MEGTILSSLDKAPARKREIVELNVQSLAMGGDGVGRTADGRAVFVARTAPGDRVRVRLTQVARRWARGSVVEVVRGSSSREKPPCAHYSACGGCQLQHIQASVERTAKGEWVREALRRIARVDMTVPEPISGELAYGYRNRLTLHLRRPREGKHAAGFHRLDRGTSVVDVHDCLLAEPAVREGWLAIRAAWGENSGGLPGGRSLRLTLRGSADGQLSLLVEGGRPGSRGRPEEISAALPNLSSYVWRDATGHSRVLYGTETLTDCWQGLMFHLGPRSFLQVNREVSALMDAYLERHAGDLAGIRVLDLYAGVGARALRWAQLGARVVACEADSAAVHSGRTAASDAGLSPEAVSFTQARVEELPPSFLQTDLVVVNPPRAGLSEQVAEMLAGAAAPRLAYVSCDPATLARDLVRLGSEWRVVSAQPFDAFPNTAHVETIVWLERASKMPACFGSPVP